MREATDDRPAWNSRSGHARRSHGWAGPRPQSAMRCEGRDLARIEAASGGRLGVASSIRSTAGRAGHRADERFPMCSTFKLLAAAPCLRGSMPARSSLDRRIRFEATRCGGEFTRHQGPRGRGGMSVAELCEAAMIVSDNTAGNLLLARLGGPAGIDRLCALPRRYGHATRSDRARPERGSSGRSARHHVAGGDSCPICARSFSGMLSRGTPKRPTDPAGCSATRPATRACAPDCRAVGASATRPGPASEGTTNDWHHLAAGTGAGPSVDLSHRNVACRASNETQRSLPSRRAVDRSSS